MPAPARWGSRPPRAARAKSCWSSATRSWRAALRAQLARLKVTEASVVGDDAARYLGGPASPFDVVFLDPPFDAGLWSAAARPWSSVAGWRPAAWIYVESPRDAPPAMPPNWALWRELNAGNVRSALYRRSPGPETSPS